MLKSCYKQEGEIVTVRKELASVSQLSGKHEVRFSSISSPLILRVLCTVLCILCIQYSNIPNSALAAAKT